MKLRFKLPNFVRYGNIMFQINVNYIKHMFTFKRSLHNVANNGYQKSSVENRMSIVGSEPNRHSSEFLANQQAMQVLVEDLRSKTSRFAEMGGAKAVARHTSKVIKFSPNSFLRIFIFLKFSNHLNLIDTCVMFHTKTKGKTDCPTTHRKTHRCRFPFSGTVPICRLRNVHRGRGCLCRNHNRYHWHIVPAT